MDAELLVPYGQDNNGLLVSAALAVQHTSYFCPDCSSPLVLRAGESVIRHFAHKENTSCNGETIAHKSAKLLLAQIISEYSSAKRTTNITLAGDCKKCKNSTSIALPSNSFTTATIEYRAGNYIYDVMAFRESIPVLGIEVFVTHKVNERKGAELQTPWIELSALDILKNPYDWRPIASRLNTVTCAECKNHLKNLEKISNDWSQPLHAPARFKDGPRENYLSAIERCWKCKKDILVYWWNGVPFATKEPPHPKPQTIKYKYSKNFGGSYWANTCPNCIAVQGDNFLFLQENALFQGLPLQETPDTKAHRSRITSKFIDRMLKNIGG